MQLKGTYYPDLVNIFYENASIEKKILISRVKGVDIIVLDDYMWISIIGFKLGELNLIVVLPMLLRNPDELEKCTMFKVDGMKRDEKVMKFIIGWILAPNGVITLG